MNNQRDHIIGKQAIEISFDGIDDTFGIQDHIAELFYEKLQPRMNKLFDEMFGKDQVVCIERLEVDCEILAADNWEEEWVETTLRKLTSQLRQADKRSRSVNEIWGEFLFYLEHGYLPWNSRIESLIQFEDELIMDVGLIRLLFELITKDHRVALRLVQHFSKGFIGKIIERTFVEKSLDKPLPEELINELKTKTKDYFIIAEAILVTVASFPGSVEEIKIEIVKKLTTQQRKNEEENAVKALNDPFDRKKEEAIYINNAGLVIFHQFLPQLYEQLGYRDKEDWKDEQSVQQAVIALQYLATGQDRVEEIELVLPKIICGLPIEEVITENLVVNENIREACDELTMAVINHWSVLKNTGIETFRNEFIQRNGKLSKVDHGWLVQVEPKAIDVLLGSLPWSIGVIRLPWMKDLVFTEWV